MTSTLERSRVLQRYADSRNGILAERIRRMPQHDFDLLYGDPEHPQPPPLISFAELEEPLPGWALDDVQRMPEMKSGKVWWEVTLIREADGYEVQVTDTSLDLAFVDARAAAMIQDQRHPVAPKD